MLLCRSSDFVAGVGRAKSVALAFVGRVKAAGVVMASPEQVVLILDQMRRPVNSIVASWVGAFRSFHAAAKREAWATLEQQAVDAVVLELTALDDDDWSFVARLCAAQGRSQHPPIVICSTLDARRRGAELGAAAYLIKPVTPQALLSVLSAALQDAGTAVPRSECINLNSSVSETVEQETQIA